MKKYFALNSLVLVGCFAAITAWTMSRKAPPPRLSSWIVYWDREEGEQRVLEGSSNLDHLSVFAVHFSSSGLEPADPWVPNVRLFLPATIPVFLTVVNDLVTPDRTVVKDPDVVSDILNDPMKRSDHIEEILEHSTGWGGVEIDYENLWKKDRVVFSDFISQLAARLHERGKQLSVVVPPQTGAPEEAKRDRGAPAYDLETIGRHANLVKVMAYYRHYAEGEPGPGAPPDWVEDVADYSRRHVPPDKLAVILSLRGLDWARGGKGRYIGPNEATSLAERTGAEIRRDPIADSPYFLYKEAGIEHEVWFEDAVSVSKKIEVLQENGIRHVGIWWLGGGTDSIWNGIPQLKKRGDEHVWNRRLYR